MSEDLKIVREKIDALDNQIHDLLMQRAELIKDVSAIKRKYNKPIVHPAREAMMLRRLLGRHSGILPQAAVIGIWRELVGGVSMLQRGLHAYVSTQSADGQSQQYCWDMAKDYCGSIIPMTRQDTSQQALSYVTKQIDALAVLPWPESNDQDQAPWWVDLAQQEDSDLPPMNIICGLPFGAQTQYDTLDKRALLISRMDYQSSGDDHSFIVVSGVDTDQIDALMTAAGMLGAEKIAQHDVFTLIKINRYISTDDEKLSALQQIVSAQHKGQCRLIGGYPVPPVLRQGDIEPVRLQE